MQPKMLKTFFECLFVVLLVIRPSQGSYCTKTGMYYAAQNYCTSYSWGGWWCWKTAYRRITVRDHYRTCCPGYKGKGCKTPICLEACFPGYICSSPDMCTLDPSAICLDPCKPGYICASGGICVVNPLFANVYSTDTNSTNSNSTNTNSTDVGVMPYNLNSTNTNSSDVTEEPYSTESPSVSTDVGVMPYSLSRTNTNNLDVTKAPKSTENPSIKVEGN